MEDDSYLFDEMEEESKKKVADNKKGNKKEDSEERKLREEQEHKAELEEGKDEIHINDRVFVCLGKLKETGLPHAWILTFSNSFDQITFWEIQNHKKFNVIGRVQNSQKKFLKAYLMPTFTEEERKRQQLKESKKEPRFEWVKEGDAEVASSDSEESESEEEEGRNKKDGRNSENKEDSDDEKEEDSSFADRMSIQVHLEDLDQRNKGNYIDHIGRIQGYDQGV